LGCEFVSGVDEEQDHWQEKGWGNFSEFVYFLCQTFISLEE